MLRTQRPVRPVSVDDLIDSAMLARLGGLDLSSRKIFFGRLKGERRSKKRGESVEFADHRPYVMGDDLRHIDWNIYGRLDRFFMKLYLEEEDLSLHLVIDASASSDCGEPSKYLFMQQAAMAMGYIGLVNLNRVACTTLAGRSIGIDEAKASAKRPMFDAAEAEAAAEAAQRQAAGQTTGQTTGLTGDPTDGDVMLTNDIRDLRGRRRMHDLSRFLCSVVPDGGTNFPAAAKRLALSRRGKGVMVVFSDFMFKEGYEQGLRMLVGRGYDVFCVQVLSPQELDPTLTGDLRLVDVEDRDRAEVTISAPLLKKYHQNLAAYCNELRDFCARREITLITIPSDTSIDSLLLDYFRKRGLLT